MSYEMWFWPAPSGRGSMAGGKSVRSPSLTVRVMQI